MPGVELGEPVGPAQSELYLVLFGVTTYQTKGLEFVNITCCFDLSFSGREYYIMKTGSC